MSQPLINKALQRITLCLMIFLGASLSFSSHAAPDVQVNTPALQVLTRSMQARHGQLLPFYQSGVIGLTQEGLIAVRDASSVPLPQRATLAALVKDENQDREQLYLGIAHANGHAEWVGEIQHTFAQRWVDRAQAGWYIFLNGAWQKK